MFVYYIHFSEVKDGGRRHLGLHRNFIPDELGECCIMNAILHSNLVKIGPTVQNLLRFIKIQDGRFRLVGKQAI